MTKLIMGYFRFECLRCGKIWRKKLDIINEKNDFYRECPSCAFDVIGELIEGV